ncbi:MAG: ion transporter [Bacteroidales bacterium]|jgi:voltage-gated sodium channel|nr:ion transporter [Bacteroidales bacterium]
MIKKLFLNDKNILILILLNAVIIFISGFELTASNKFLFRVFDNIITGLFIAELTVKLYEYGFKKYFSSSWNIFDLTLIALSVPALISFIMDLEITNISFLLVFRVMRVFKSFRFLKFIPGVEHLLKGIQRALKTSIIVLAGFAVYIFIIGILSFYLFKSSAPEYFSNPLTSLYSIFKIFTVEGWFEIPEQITIGYSSISAFLTYIYFIFILLTGGIFGLSLVNSIFVDAMVSDNNDELEQKIDNIEKKITELITQNNKHVGSTK